MKHQIFVLGAVLATGLMPAQAIAANFTGMYVFGDSLSDTGNVFKSTEATSGSGLPPFPYVDGRFSNGPVWIDYLAQDLGLAPVTYSDVFFNKAESPTGINFAYGGATTGTKNTVADILPGLKIQLALFGMPGSPAQPTDPDALYILWAGANDYLPTTSSSFEPRTDTDFSVNNLTVAVSSLYGLGARHFLVGNLPDLGVLPLVRNTPLSTSLSQLTAEHNQKLAANLSLLSSTLPDIKLRSLDVNSLFAQAQSSELGFTDTQNPCFNEAVRTICENPDEFLFWDQIHPTTVAHRQVATLAFNTLSPATPAPVPEPATALGLLVVGAMGTVTLKRKAA